MGFPLCLRQIHLSRVFERMGVSPVATGDQRLCLWKPRAFEKARPKLTDLVRRVTQIWLPPGGSWILRSKRLREHALLKVSTLFPRNLYPRCTQAPSVIFLRKCHLPLGGRLYFGLPPGGRSPQCGETSAKLTEGTACPRSRVAGGGARVTKG